MKTASLLVLNLMFALCSLGQLIQVDAASVIRSFDHRPAAVNLNYLMDDDSYLNPAIPLSQSLSQMGIGTLRYPGGEKSDNYLWSVPPYTQANPQFATPGNCNWPNNQTTFSSNYINPLPTTLDFDEFMTLCQTLKIKPLIVVSGDAQFNTFCPTPTSLASLITNATEWIKYANLTHSYKIKNWAIGNESFNSAAYDAPPTATQYANDFKQFSIAMKAMDPTISVIANAKSGPWVDTLVSIAGPYIDAIAVSNYPIYNWTNGYDTYRSGSPNLVSEINAVLSAVSATSIHVIVTEYNSIDWGNAWSGDNDLGHALVNFQLFGDQMSIPKVEDAYIWTTRWIDNATNPQHIYDALDANGGLNATGKALAMWGNNLLSQLVSTTNNGYINSFATKNSAGDSLNIFLINKDYVAHTASVSIANYAALSLPGLQVSASRLSGSSPSDKVPVITVPSGSISVSGSTLTSQLSPFSITVIQLRQAPHDTTTSPPVITGLLSQRADIRSMIAYPNPVHNVLEVTFEGAITHEEEIRLVNGMGQQVYSGKTPSQKMSISMAEFPQGIYLLLIGNFKKVIVKE